MSRTITAWRRDLKARTRDTEILRAMRTMERMNAGRGVLDCAPNAWTINSIERRAGVALAGKPLKRLRERGLIECVKPNGEPWDERRDLAYIGMIFLYRLTDAGRAAIDDLGPNDLLPSEERA